MLKKLPRNTNLINYVKNKLTNIISNARILVVAKVLVAAGGDGEQDGGQTASYTERHDGVEGSVGSR